MFLYKKGKFDEIKTYNEPDAFTKIRINYFVDYSEVESFKKTNTQLYNTIYEVIPLSREQTFKYHRKELINELGYEPQHTDDIRVSKFTFKVDKVKKDFKLILPVIFEENLPKEDFIGNFIIHDFDIKRGEQIGFLSFLGIERKFTNINEVSKYLLLNDFDIIRVVYLSPVSRYILIGRKIPKEDVQFPYMNKIYNVKDNYDWLVSYDLKIKKIDEDVFFYNKSKNMKFKQLRIENYDQDPSFDLSYFFVEDIRMKCKTNKSDITIFDVWEQTKHKLKSILDLKERRDALFNIVKEEKTALCSPFLPSVTKAIIKYTNSRKMLDMSAGWGDRLLGAISEDCKYVGFDPNIKLKDAHNEMIDMFAKKKSKYKIYYEPFENVDDFLEEDDMFDLMLSSPPFFDLEIYDTKNQSIISYPKFDDWLNKWLLPSMTKVYNHIKKDGYICVHIVDFDNYSIVLPLFTHMKNLGLQIENPFTYGSKNYKPIFTWKKV